MQHGCVIGSILGDFYSPVNPGRFKRATIEHSDAIEQSLLYSYLVDRETFDAADNEARLLKVFRRSAGQARATLERLWQEDNPNFPPKIYGAGARAQIKVLSIQMIAENTAQIRYIKTLRVPEEPVREGKFYATVVYGFQPQNQANLNIIWENPFGFTVTSYRTTSETAGG